MAALHFLLPTGHSPSGSSGFDSKLISLLPLDEVPVHVPLRRPRPLRFERLRVRGCGKADANPSNPLSTCYAKNPNSPSRPSLTPFPAPSPRNSYTNTPYHFPSTASPPAPLAIRKAPSASVESIQPKPLQPCEVGRPKGRRHLFDNISDIFSAPRAPQPIPSQSIPFPKAMF